MSPMRPLVVVTLLIGAVPLCAGCQNQPSHFANPLYSADRVPPPGTRSLAPGSAQPYYSGDPLPAIPTGSPLSGQSSEATSGPAKSLDWASPTTVSAPTPPEAVAGVAQVSATTAPPASATTAEWWDAPLKSAAPAQEVLPVAWSDFPPTSTPPRVRIPHSQPNPPGQQLESTFGPEASPATDGFRPRGSRSAPY